jgi:hypothetical protein
LIYEARGKVDIKMSRMMSMNCEIFGENFIIFGPREVSKQNREKNIQKMRFFDWSI